MQHMPAHTVHHCCQLSAVNESGQYSLRGIRECVYVVKQGTLTNAFLK